MKSLFHQNIQDNKYRGYISEYQMLKEIKAHNVLLERVQLYHDFIYNLTTYLYNTYLGREYLSKSKDIEGHFNWGYNKVIAEFKEEGIDFSYNTYLKEYFITYFNTELYNKEPDELSKLLEFWEEVFTFRSDKNTNEFQLLLTVYERFDVTFNNKNF